MAWWDHEELKPLKYRSDRYKLAFPDAYDRSEIQQLKLIRELEEELSNWRRRDERRAAQLKEYEIAVKGRQSGKRQEPEGIRG